MKCCFCKKQIEKTVYWDKGNNALPVMDGRCCDECNNGIVIPIRILRVSNSPLLMIGKLNKRIAENYADQLKNKNGRRKKKN